MAFFADALAHGTLLGVALAAWWQLPTGIGIALVSIAVVLGLVFMDDERLPADAVLAVVAVSLLCLGLLALTQLTDQQANVLGFLFSNLLWRTFARIEPPVDDQAQHIIHNECNQCGFDSTCRAN